MQVKSIAKMFQGEHSAIISTFTKLPFVIKIYVLYIFEWPLKTGFTVKQYCAFIWNAEGLLQTIIRIYRECKDEREKIIPIFTVSVFVITRLADRVMAYGDPEERIFLSHPHSNNGFFFLLTLKFRILY